jgi:hypothetical protein
MIWLNSMSNIGESIAMNEKRMINFPKISK